jgi:hypothetical protein
MIVGILSVMFTVQPLESIMPFFMNGLRICSAENIKPTRAGASAIGTYLIVLAVAVPFVLWAVHNYGVRGGAQAQGRWSTATLPAYFYDAGDDQITDLKNEAKLTEAENYTAAQRMYWKNWDIQPAFLWAAGLGVAAVLVMSVLRLRLPWWPIHPVLFLIWGTRQAAEISGSFLIGWAIKSAVTNLGGMPTYRSARKFMFGAIAGDLIGALIFMIVGMLYYNITGEVPKPYSFFPQMN